MQTELKIQTQKGRISEESLRKLNVHHSRYVFDI